MNENKFNGFKSGPLPGETFSGHPVEHLRPLTFIDVNSITRDICISVIMGKSCSISASVHKQICLRYLSSEHSSSLNIAIKKTDLWTLINESIRMKDVNDMRLEDQTYY